MAFDWKKVVGTVAPAIGTVLGGPLAGVATQAVVAALGLPQNSPDDAIAAAVQNASPETLLALKNADKDFALKMRALDVDLERIAADDRNSARIREAQVRDWMPRVLGAVVVSGFLGTVFMVLGGYVEGLKDPLMATTVGTLIGYVSSKADQIVSYYYGSSAGSRSKDEALNSALRNKV